MATQPAMYRTSLLAVMVLVLAACAGPATNPTTAPTTRPAATSAATLAPTTAAATAGATTKPGGGEAVVDLTFSGDRALVAKGSKGDCRLGTRADGTVVVFGFFASESDYAGLGDSFSLIEDLASHQVSVKWVVAGTFYAGVFSSGVTVSPDHHSIMLGADLPAGIDRHEHLSGSITCP